MKNNILEIMAGFAAPCAYGITASDASLAAQEVTAHVIEFIEWLSSFNNGHIERCGVGWRILTKNGEEYFKERSIEEVYQYWINNIKHESNHIKEKVS